MSGLSSFAALSEMRFQMRPVMVKRSSSSAPPIRYTRFQLRDSGRLWPFDWCTMPTPA